MEKRYSSFFWNALWSADSRATRNTVLSTSTRIFTDIYRNTKDWWYGVNQWVFTWVFRMPCRAKIRKPCSIKMISRSFIFTICKQINQIPIKFSKKERKLHTSQMKKKSVLSSIFNNLLFQNSKNILCDHCNGVTHTDLSRVTWHQEWESSPRMLWCPY